MVTQAWNSLKSACSSMYSIYFLYLALAVAISVISSYRFVQA